MRLPREQMRILAVLDKHHHRDDIGALVMIEDVAKETRLSVKRCGSELVLLNKAGYVQWFSHLGGPSGTQGHILQKGREAVQETSWTSRLETLPAEVVTALIPAAVGILLSPASWQALVGAFVIGGGGWRTGIRLLRWR